MSRTCRACEEGYDEPHTCDQEEEIDRLRAERDEARKIAIEAESYTQAKRLSKKWGIPLEENADE